MSEDEHTEFEDGSNDSPRRVFRRRIVFGLRIAFSMRAKARIA